MKIDAAAVRKCLKSFDFTTLFREHLGWDKYRATLDVVVDGRPVSLGAVAEKRGFIAYVCQSIPDRSTRLKIDHQVTKSAKEHFVIYCDQPAGEQLWHWVRREAGKPSASRDRRFRSDQSGDHLIQSLEQIAVRLSDEESITLVDVAAGARAAFDVDRVTKKFYDQFTTEHAAFRKFIKGIESDADLQWYTSLMLNRLMFVYFIQKKGFLDGDTSYLRNRLRMVREAQGKDKFQSFYRYFLLRLFHEGLGQSPEERKLDATMGALLGKVPYLNGGFFEVHQLEERNTEIDIPDRAFEKLFDFFDRYSWHLDERPLRDENEINPDVVGYIFEKYINQKQMGAYYTKEDITEYISKNTIIPFLFDAAQRKCPIAFDKGSFTWRLLQEDPDRYIYPAVGHGVCWDYDPRKGQHTRLDTPRALPAAIEAGVASVAHRENWNQTATAEFALPAETWREVVARRTRCLELRDKLRRGDIQSIDEFVTLNLDSWQFASDAIVNAEGPELLRAFWQAIENVTILDPTCGSGAFLFAALRILETLYSDCLERMERFVEDQVTKPTHPEPFNDFKKVLAQIEKHPNERYFILKSIIIGNLFGVDIMEEAVEICKLRLFLKLASQVERVDQIEPLPDIDFNIRPGNTLVGYVTKQHARQAFTGAAAGQGKLMLGDAEDAYKRFEEDAESVERAFRQFRLQQTAHGGRVTLKDKQELRRRLTKLDSTLDRYLAGEYGINPDTKSTFEKWRAGHQPFHWFVHFYGIMRSGGFDVIIGNPPWAEYSTVKKMYTVHGYETQSCGNLHTLCTERALRLRTPTGSLSFIVQLPLASSSRMAPARRLLRESSANVRVAFFDDRPGKLFEGLQHCRSTIFVASGGQGGGHRVFVTRYQRWQTEVRGHLFPGLVFTRLPDRQMLDGDFAKIDAEAAQSVFAKLISNSTSTLGAGISRRATRSFVFYQEATQYWVKAVVGVPYYSKDGRVGEPAHGRALHCDDVNRASIVAALLNSSLFYLYFIAYGDCFHLSDGLATAFPLAEAVMREPQLSALGKRLDKDLRANAERKTINTKDGHRITYDEFVAARSKPIIDEIDGVLAKHYGFSDEELDFVVNYDIKHRVGAEDGSDAE